MRYEFGEYTLLPSERLLLRRGERVALKPKVFDTLLALVQNPGRLLSKEELIGLIWPDSYAIADGYLYITCSQINKQPDYNNGVNKRTSPYTVYRMKLPQTHFNLRNKAIPYHNNNRNF